MSDSEPKDKQVEISLDIAVGLLTSQFPQWSQFAIEPIISSGTDNALFSLGNDMVIRIPRATWATWQVDKEQRWLPRLAPKLPLPVPVPLAQGHPDETYPCAWSVYRWLDGEDVETGGLGDLTLAAADLAGFLKSLQGIDAAGGPLAGKHNNYRGIALAGLDGSVRSSIAALGDLIDTSPAERAWEADRDAPLWGRAPVWVHGDLHGANLLASGGRLSGVIDWGLAGVGDPACDLMPAWNLFSGQSREVFRAAMQVDDASWARGRGWALFGALVALPYYLETNPAIVRRSWHVLKEVLADHI